MSMLEKNVHDAQFPTGPAANHLQYAAPFTGQPPTLGEIQCRADTIDLDYGGLYGNDLDDWLRAERVDRGAPPPRERQGQESTMRHDTFPDGRSSQPVASGPRITSSRKSEWPHDFIEEDLWQRSDERRMTQRCHMEVSRSLGRLGFDQFPL